MDFDTAAATSNEGATGMVFPRWSQKTIPNHCLSLFPIISQLGYRKSSRIFITFLQTKTELKSKKFQYYVSQLDGILNTCNPGQYKTWTADCGPRTADWV